MHSVTAFLAALWMVAPATPAGVPVLASAAHESAVAAPTGAISMPGHEPEPYSGFRDSYLPQVQQQMHIEQRVIIRIAPSGPQAREDLSARIPRDDTPAGYKEKKYAKCVAIDDIAAVQPTDDNRLLLFMRNHMLLTAALERACDAQAFYLGFYIARNADGMLCSKRDELQARTGANCEITRISRLVATKD